MAINKKQTSVWMKAVLIFVVFAFVASIIGPALFAGLGSGPAPAGSETGAVLEQIASAHAPAIASNTVALESDPDNYDVLVNLGNSYYDWALRIMGALQQGSGQDLPMWNAATVYYERALAVQPGDPNVMTDMAIAYFYSGNVSRAIEVAEQVFAESPDFAPAYYNSAVFYRMAARTADAVTALERYLELEPEGTSADAARQMLQEMEGVPSAPEPSGETTGPAGETTQP